MFFQAKLLVSREYDRYWLRRCEAHRTGSAWYATEVGTAVERIWSSGTENEHAQADQGMAEEDCDYEDQKDESDVELLAGNGVGYR